MTLEMLCERVKERLSDFRYRHTLSVLDMARTLGSFCLPGKIPELSAAALLHDITKELSDEEQIRIIELSDIKLSEGDVKSPQVFHSYTAPYVVKRDFPEFATEEILSSLLKHTVGDADMSVFDKIIFISDYTEAGRRYPACVKTREFLLSNLRLNEEGNNMRVLDEACLMAIDNTLEGLKEKGRDINEKTVQARISLIGKLNKC